jgi:hypothetical protein
MSLTEAQSVFAAIHEDGLNDLLRRFFNARPRYLNYGSPGFVAGTTVNSTQMAAIQFPGIPGGIDWSVQIAQPRVDAHPQSAPLPPELDPLGLQRLSIHTAVEICVNCNERHERDDNPDHNPDKDPKDDHHGDKPPNGNLRPVCFKVEVFAIAHAERTSSPDGDAIRFIVDAIELVDLQPNDFETLIECLLLQILRAVLASVRLPLPALSAGAFTLTPTVGPEIENDQIEMYGNL